MKELQEKTIMMTALNDIVFELNEDFVFVNIFTSDDDRLFLPREQAVGDELLRLFASILKKECRENDTVARTGESEFVILLPRTTSETAEKIVQRIKEEIFSTETDKIPLSAAFSFGTKTKSDEIFDQIYRDTEKKIFQQKNQNETIMKV